MSAKRPPPGRGGRCWLCDHENLQIGSNYTWAQVADRAVLLGASVDQENKTVDGCVYYKKWQICSTCAPGGPNVADISSEHLSSIKEARRRRESLAHTRARYTPGLLAQSAVPL